MDGRFCVWKLNEAPNDEDKPQLMGELITAIQIMGEGESLHPRVCWHPNKQDILVVAISKTVLKIDTAEVIGQSERTSAEEPLICCLDELLNGIRMVAKHDA